MSNVWPRIRNWFTRSAITAELDQLDKSEQRRLAEDCGLPENTLRTIAAKRPDSLLANRLYLVGIDHEWVAHEHPSVLRDMERVCSQCAEQYACRRTLEHDRGGNEWRHFCPNRATFDALGADVRRVSNPDKFPKP